MEIGPNKCKLQLCHAFRSGNSKQVVKLLNRIKVEVGSNIRVSYLDGETIFKTAKQKSNLLLDDDSDFQHRNQVNYFFSMLGMSPTQGMVNPFPRAILRNMPSSQSLRFMMMSTLQFHLVGGEAIMSTKLLIIKFPCLDPL